MSKIIIADIDLMGVISSDVRWRRILHEVYILFLYCYLFASL